MLVRRGHDPVAANSPPRAPQTRLKRSIFSPSRGPMNRKSSRESQEKSSSELEDYDVMEEIASGNTSTVYLVNCKRGRLRNRQLVLRKIPANRSEPTEPALIHLSLSHPCIVSLFSTFSTSSADFYVLELCGGAATLSSYLENSPLSEAHLRGVLKGLFEALVYLKKQGVVHRNIRLSNILLTTDSRIKLADFKLATHLPPSKLPADCFVNAPHFVAPEILRNSTYTCDADLWSAGCIALSCLSGQLPFEANSNGETVDDILNALYVLPQGISPEAQDLVVKLLDI
ncbi:kinase-like domain-containing protein, partial [Mycena olivaceomarginata]